MPKKTLHNIGVIVETSIRKGGKYGAKTSRAKQHDNDIHHVICVENLVPVPIDVRVRGELPQRNVSFVGQNPDDRWEKELLALQCRSPDSVSCELNLASKSNHPGERVQCPEIYHKNRLDPSRWFPHSVSLEDRIIIL